VVRLSVPPPRRLPSSTPRSENDWSETVGDRRFPSSRFQEAAYWTENRDLRLTAEAARNGGVLTTSELYACGFSDSSIRSAVRRGPLTRRGAGYDLRRFTALQAIDEPALVIAQIAGALAAAQNRYFFGQAARGSPSPLPSE
jgi:hypothetical protein